MTLKLFILVTKNSFKCLKWNQKEINITGKYLNDLRFTNNIVLIAQSKEELTEMLPEVEDISNRTELI